MLYLMKLQKTTLLVAGAVVAVILAFVLFSLYLQPSGTNPSTPLQQHSETDSSKPSQQPSEATPPAPVLLTGSGATFPMEQIRAWISQVRSIHPWLQVEYAGGGSGKGQSDLLQGIVDFAASDTPFKTQDWERARNLFGGVYQLPIILGGVAVVYNVPEVPSNVNLRFTVEVLVDILLGEIEYWDDPRIKELNPGVELPHAKIVFVHRSDSSGTTEVFTTFLSLHSKKWKEKVGAGKLVKWPLDELGRGVGAPGNPGVAQAVKNTPYSLGYVELAYAKGLGVAALKNKAGKYVVPSSESIKAAAAGGVAISDAGANLAELKILESILNSDNPDAYPITSPSYLLLKSPSSYPPEKRRALAVFLEYIFSKGQSAGNVVEGYVAVPDSWRQLGLKVASEFKERS